MVIVMDSVNVASFVAGAAFTIIVFIFNGAFDKVERWDNTNLLINYCEVELPRTQSCKLVAVPKEVGDE
jgi:hypothetical protein